MKQQHLIYILLLCIGVIAIMGIICKKSYPEPFNHYRELAGCPQKTGYLYLDVYDQGDYYRDHPYIFPTKHSYTTVEYDKTRQYWPFMKLLEGS